MPRKLTLVEQRKLVRALPAHRIAAVRSHCRKCEMKGEGILSILKTICKALGPVAKELGPVVLKELVLPLLTKKLFKGKGRKPRKKASGRGLSLPGQGLSLPGSGLRLAGQGIRRR